VVSLRATIQLIAGSESVFLCKAGYALDRLHIHEEPVVVLDGSSLSQVVAHTWKGWADSETMCMEKADFAVGVEGLAVSSLPGPELGILPRCLGHTLGTWAPFQIHRAICRISCHPKTRVAHSEACRVQQANDQSSRGKKKIGPTLGLAFISLLLL
jgi:hypothetical protein